MPVRLLIQIIGKFSNNFSHHTDKSHFLILLWNELILKQLLPKEYSQTCIKRTSTKQSPSIKLSLTEVPEIISLNYSKTDLH